jgi:hypothetical protein
VLGKGLDAGGKIALNTMTAGAQTLATSTVTSALSAVTYSHDGGFGFSNEIFSAGLESGARGMVSSFVGGALNLSNLFDGNNIALANIVFNTKNIATFNSTIGGLIGESLDYAMGGDFSLNLLNIQFGGNSTGLLELNLSKEKGVKMNIGTDGVNLSLGTISVSKSGVDFGSGTLFSNITGGIDAVKIGGAKLASAFGKPEGVSKLNAINMLGYTDNERNYALAKAIFKGEQDVIFEKDVDYLGKTDGGNIYLSDIFLGNGKEKSGQLASMLSHENAHILGADEFVSRIEGYSTYASLMNTFGLTGKEFDGLTDIAHFTNVLKNGGAKGLYGGLLYNGALEANSGTDDYYLFKIKDPGWRQNDRENKSYTLGEGWTKELVDSTNRDILETTYSNERHKAYLEYAAEQEANSIEAVGEEEYEYKYKNADEFKNGVGDDGLKKLGVQFATYDTLSNSGCTLATAAYLAYSLTGKLVSLKEINDILVNEDLFVRDGSNFGQQNLIANGSGYAKVVNTLAGIENLIEYISSYSDTNSIISKLIDINNEQDNGYLAHIRQKTDNGNMHSTIVAGLQISYTDNSVSKINTLDPMGGPSVDLDRIKRMDIFKVNISSLPKPKFTPYFTGLYSNSYYQEKR